MMFRNIVLPLTTKLHYLVHNNINNNIPCSILAVLLVMQGEPFAAPKQHVDNEESMTVDIERYRQSRAVRCGIVQT